MSGIQGSTARRNPEQQVGYLRFKVNFNDPGLGVAQPKQWLPAGAVIIGTDVLVTTAFVGTTPALAVGFEPGTFTNIVTGAQSAVTAAGLKSNLPGTGLALAPLTQDQQVFALLTGAALTAGAAYVVIKYVCDNDLNVGQ